MTPDPRTEEIRVRPGKCDCTANGCEPHITVDVSDEGIVGEVHGLDDKPDDAARLARLTAAFIESVSDGALTAVRHG